MLQGMREPLRRILHRECPDWLRNEVEDLVQQALMRLHGLARREGIESFGASYQWRVAHSVIVDEIRKRRRRREVALTEDLVATGPATEDPDPEQLSAGREAGRAIQSCLGSLSEARRRAVTLYLLGHTIPDSARLLSWTAKKTENLVYRGLADLRHCLQSKGVEP